MSVALRATAASIPEFEYNDGVDRSVHYLEHGFPDPLVRWHCHDDYELHLITQSSGKMFVGDHVGTFGPGNVVLTGPRLPHNWISQIRSGEQLDVRDRLVQFNQNLIQDMARIAPELASLHPLLERARYGIQFSTALAAELEPQICAIRDSEGPHRIALLLEILQRLADEQQYTLLSTLALRSDHDDAMLDKIEKVTRHVTEHYASEISLSDVAALVGMQESAFSRFFSKATGNGFSRFLNRIRIAKACELLSMSEKSITDICFDSGFKNVANFNRRFREIKAVTPREYRKASQLRHASVLVEETANSL